jgi:hypothetical protein
MPSAYITVNNLTFDRIDPLLLNARFDAISTRERSVKIETRVIS